MNFSRIGILTIALAGMVVSGCTSDGLRGSTRVCPRHLLLAGRSRRQVQTGQLPPPGQPGVTDSLAVSSSPRAGRLRHRIRFGVRETLPTGRDAGCPSLRRRALRKSPPAVSPWSGMPRSRDRACRIATPQNSALARASVAGPLRCPAPLDQVKSWNVSGSQLTLYDESGSALARLYSSNGRFEGQTSSGQPISLVR